MTGPRLLARTQPMGRPTVDQAQLRRRAINWLTHLTRTNDTTPVWTVGHALDAAARENA